MSKIYIYIYNYLGIKNTRSNKKSQKNFLFNDPCLDELISVHVPTHRIVLNCVYRFEKHEIVVVVADKSRFFRNRASRSRSAAASDCVSATSIVPLSLSLSYPPPPFHSDHYVNDPGRRRKPREIHPQRI